MPKVRTDIKNLEQFSKASRLEDKYPYLNDCLDGKTYELVSGKDFTTKTETMRQGIKLWAERNGIAMSVKTQGENVLVQAKPVAKRTAKRKPRKR